MSRMAKPPAKPTMITTGAVAENRRARYDYTVLDTIEAGIVLAGTEVKSLRNGKASLQEAFATIDNGEVWVRQMHIPPYEQGNRANPDPLRKRKLLVHSRELRRMYGKVKVSGYTLVPTKLYFKDGRAKVEIGLAKGKTTYDKRQTLAKKEADRDIQRAFKTRDRED